MATHTAYASPGDLLPAVPATLEEQVAPSQARR